MLRCRRRVAVTTAAVVCAGSAFGPVALAQADAASSFYVDNGSSVSCSDTTTYSAVTPYCTIQAAVDAATEPGDTVVVSPGTYASFTVTASGTAAAPITIEGSGGSGFAPEPWAVVRASTSSAVTLTGASYVAVRGLRIFQTGNHSGVAVTNGTGDVVDSDFVQQAGSDTAPVVSIGAGSSSATVSRDELDGTTKGGGVGTQGGSGDVITTDVIVNSNGPSVALNGTTSSDVTANTLNQYCGTGIDVTNGSTSASVENNVVEGMSVNPSVCGSTAAAEAQLQVDAASVTGTSADYNVSENEGSSYPNVYSWDGHYYTTAAAFEAATGQGAHDVSGAPVIDSANSDAPGELSTDLYGNARVDDPDVANTGAGTFSYYDRGAIEEVDPVTIAAVNLPTQAPAGKPGMYETQVSDGWGNSFTCAYTFGDGSAPVSVTPDSSGNCNTVYAYTSTGSYQAQLAVISSDGNVSTKKFTVSVVADSSPLTPVAAVTASGALGVAVDASQTTDSWNLALCSFDFGDGSTPVITSGSTCAATHTYAKAGTYPVITTVRDSGEIQQSVTHVFTTAGSSYTPVTPARILDTRNGTGVAAAGPVAPGGIVRLKIAGVDGLPPTGVSAVALNVTATEATKLGVITAYPDGQSEPDVSNVDFKAGQNVANTVIVAVGADGYVDLANASSGTTHFIADLQGYYWANGSSGYQTITPIRLLDTRTTAAIPAGHTVKVDLSSYPGISAAMLNLTVVDATGNGFITVSPDGGAAPTTSNVNYLAGQTVPNEAVVAVGADDYVDVTNSGKGQAEVVVDLDGFFTTGTGSAFVPVDPARYLDTRPGAGLSINETFDVGIGGVCPPNPSCTGAPAVPTGARAVAANLTVVSPTANGFITVFPANVTTAPNASVLNFLTGQQTQNAITVGLDPTYGRFAVHNASLGNTETIVDVFGYYGD
ncbi:PKD domain-containing protein [Actinospica durhamensis]|uniref:PKD domain-containing protein n=1 Tax=Actinospica durhamensis TaxID=1508375 RepID=A0A941ELV7_9ACTN|nr:PKD domain-containing protein [Actinospica durhamensis]MBR7833335.1 PKD domain-containing protein [Actinospica durhamensis]